MCFHADTLEEIAVPPAVLVNVRRLHCLQRTAVLFKVRNEFARTDVRSVVNVGLLQPHSSDRVVHPVGTDYRDRFERDDPKRPAQLLVTAIAPPPVF